MIRNESLNKHQYSENSHWLSIRYSKSNSDEIEIKKQVY